VDGVSTTPSFEHDRRLRAGFVGCGDHSFRNVYPALRYLPVDLVAVCDLDAGRAARVARTFGAERDYTDLGTMLDDSGLDCAFVVTGFERRGKRARLTHPDLVVQCLEAGVATWVEKPAVATLDDVARIRKAMAASGKAFGVGHKKAFAPANVKLKELVDRPEFGAVRSMTLRYAQPIPPLEALAAPQADGDWLSPWQHFFLDHLCHPLAVLRLVGGPVRSLYYERAETGHGMALFTMVSGAVASLHLPNNYAMRSIQERTEVAGDGGVACVENNIRVTWSPNPSRETLGTYGREALFTKDGAESLVWEPEFSLGQLYNKGLFLLGYYHELAAFCDAVLEGRPVEVGSIDDAEEAIRIYDAFAEGPGRVVDLACG